jgi:hypothetical protein
LQNAIETQGSLISSLPSSSTEQFEAMFQRVMEKHDIASVADLEKLSSEIGTMRKQLDTINLKLDNATQQTLGISNVSDNNILKEVCQMREDILAKLNSSSGSISFFSPSHSPVIQFCSFPMLCAGRGVISSVRIPPHLSNAPLTIFSPLTPPSIRSLFFPPFCAN